MAVHLYKEANVIPVLVEYRSLCSKLGELLAKDRYKSLLSPEASCIGCCRDASVRELFAKFLQEYLIEQRIDPVRFLEICAKSHAAAIAGDLRFNGLSAKIEWRREAPAGCFNLDTLREGIGEFLSYKHAHRWLNGEPVD